MSIENNEMSKKARSKIKIMHGAKCLFEKRGFEQVTFNDIAEEAGVCRTTVFNHFANTEELMMALCKQEIEDIEKHCSESKLQGVPLIRELFNKLIEDTAYYPILTTRLTNSEILGNKMEKSITKIEKLIEENLQWDNSKEITILIMGAYYGLVNHYHSNNKIFESVEMKKEFNKLLNIILGGDRNE